MFSFELMYEPLCANSYISNSTKDWSLLQQIEGSGGRLRGREERGMIIDSVSFAFFIRKKKERKEGRRKRKN